MKPENAIEVKNVTKSFKIYLDKGSTIKEKVLFRNRRRYENRQVLRGISFDVKKGEAIGLIGHNGCGKSTTLKLLTKIMYPDSGTIEMKGRVSSLIELGAGFHPDMSGRENIYINASIFGLTRREIDEKIDAIIEFSELEDYIDNPVRTYSSGMYMRLAFAVAINVDADILLIDEILAVGDATFQTKCFNKLREIKSKGVTIVIVSHSLGQIEQICERSIWIHEGLVREDGAPRDVHPAYLDFMQEEHVKRMERLAQVAEQTEGENIESGEGDESVQADVGSSAEVTVVGEEQQSEECEIQPELQPEPESQPEELKRWGNGKARIEKVVLQDAAGKNKVFFETGEKIIVRMKYSLKHRVEDAVFGIGIFRIDGLQCYGTNTRIDKVPTFDLVKDGELQLVLENVNLIPGEYMVDLAIQSGIGVAVDYYREATRFEIYSKIEDVGVFRIDHNWNIENG